MEEVEEIAIFDWSKMVIFDIANMSEDKTAQPRTVYFLRRGKPQLPHDTVGVYYQGVVAQRPSVSSWAQ
jgi:hypothetical protein